MIKKKKRRGGKERNSTKNNTAIYKCYTKNTYYWITKETTKAKVWLQTTVCVLCCDAWTELHGGEKEEENQATWGSVILKHFGGNNSLD